MSKPKPICIVGIPGSGKTTLVREYQSIRSDVYCLTGSAVIAEVIKPLTLADYKTLPSDEKFHLHEKALTYLHNLYVQDSRLVVVDGHLSFQMENPDEFEEVFTESDNNLYGTLILFNPPASVIFERRLNDKNKLRCTSLGNIKKHADFEANLARKMASKHGFTLFEIETPNLEESLLELDLAVNSILALTSR